MLDPRRWPRAIVLALAGVLVVGVGVAVAAAFVLGRPGDVSHPNVPFGTNQAPPPSSQTTPVPTKHKRREKKVVDTFVWPFYGYTPDHNRDYQPPHPLHGPWRKLWTYHAGALLEFPPSLYRGSLLVLADDGRLAALDNATGKVRWRKRLGTLAASTPAVGHHGTVYASVLDAGGGTGTVAALRISDGKVLWKHPLPSRTESSPLLHGGRVYVGTEGGLLLCLDASSGKTIWTYQAAGSIKGSPTLVSGVLYFGDYGGHVQAVKASDGHVVWNVAPGAGLHGVTFYATAAVAYGRVYIGGTDGREYSFAVGDGQLAWARQTGAYVYSSAAVADVPGHGPTVFFGSYDGTLYAVDAKTGATRWTYASGGKISGSPTVIGDTVYIASLGAHRTVGLRTSDGKKVFGPRDGAFAPPIADEQRLYLTGHSALAAFQPRPAHHHHHHHHRQRHQRRPRRHHGRP